MRERSTDITFFRMISYISTMCMHIYGTLEKSFLLYLILVRFEHLNEKIVPKVSWGKHEPKTIDISNVQIMHSMLYDAQQAFNDIYRNPLLIWFANLMMHVLGSVSIFRENQSFTACAFAVPPVMQMLILCAICHYTAKEV